ncbi:MAG: hypothetical protein EAZ92_15140 [Candidatus Kapaibacterium sp.]|nr:MAG: hypothetical protein EAZ92_15140 [Candidatus Kapabacteria bacterium]
MNPIANNDSRRKTTKVAELLPLRSIPLNKSALTELASNYAGFIRTDSDKFALLVAIKAGEEYLKALKAAIMGSALLYAEVQRANGVHCTESGAKFSVRVESVWDFSRDTKHRQLTAQCESGTQSTRRIFEKTCASHYRRGH